MNIAAYPAYEGYSPVDVDWIEQVPANWEVMRIQDFSTFNDDVVDERAYRNRLIRYVDISGVDSASNTYSFEDQDFSAAPSRARRLARSGDTVFSTVRPYLKAVATVMCPEDDLVFSTGFAVIRPRGNANPRFVGYLLRNDRFVDEVTANSVGASYPAINATDLAKMHVPLPLSPNSALSHPSSTKSVPRSTRRCGSRKSRSRCCASGGRS
ncbi:restriction endonuclease subunit S [Falsirhodobacter xinxiangensis]|uniref:restriction endonuclease subunit S n=1 Tax=Falsirhodobacter xinxiangensis TaxID=2530049 RepID=UPI0010AB1530|nr:restriction endonuclease subunit S [Rhodobacter xinxiangensis]